MLRSRVCFQLALLIVSISFATGTFAQKLVWSSFPVGSTTSDTFYAGTIDSSSNVYLAGRNGSSLLVQKISANGTTMVYRAIFPATPPFSYGFQIEDIRVDSTGAAYVVGYSSPNFPTTSNAFLGSVTSGDHAFVAVVNPTGTALTYATYLAGTTSATDTAYGVAVDSLGKIYVTGDTDSLTFPTTAGVFQTKNSSGSQTAFVAKIDPTKSGAASLVYSTYLSGLTSTDVENAIAVDSSGDAYVTGNVSGSDFPVTKGAFTYDGEGLGQGGVYVTKLNPTATALVYSAYLGVGTGNGIAVDGSGLAYVTGSISSYTDFPTTTGAFQVTYPDGFASQLNAAGSALGYSTFLSGAQESTFPIGIAIEPGCTSPCDAFIVGYTGEDDLTLTNPIQDFNASYVNGSTGNDVFVTELNTTGTAAVFSTYIGGSSDDSSQNTAHSPSIAVNSTGDAYVVGETSSTDFPVTLTATTQRSTFALEIAPAAGVTAVAYPITLAFPTNQPTGVASAPLVVNLRNMGSNPMTITSITPAPAAYTETNTCGTTLAAGGECPISVTFKPTTAASTPGTLTILQGGLSTVVNLTGTGVAQGFLTLNPTSLTFANQSVDFASPFQTVTVGNSATTSLTLSNPPFSFSSSPSNAFAQTNNCPTSLATNATCTVNIAFLPTENGPFTGDMFVNSNTNGLATPTFVTLSGNGVVGTPTLTLASAGLVFNPQVVGTTSPSQFVIVTNTGNVPVTIFGVSITGAAFMDYTETGCVQTLSPGQECFARISLVPTATGTRAATVTLADSTTVGSHTFTVTGTGQTQTLTLAFDPPALTFANLAVGATSTPALIVQVTNTGDASVPIDRVFTTGDFRVSSTGCVTTGLRVGSVCNISVEFTPTATGARTGSIVIEDTASGNPQKVTLTGTGLADAPAAIATPDSLNLGTQAEGTTSPTAFTVILDNIGNEPFDASNVAITGTNAGDFQIYAPGSNCSGNIVVPGRNCQIQVTFTPTAAGTRTGALTFTNAGGTQTVNLTGTGVTATLALVVSPATLTYQTQQKGVQSPGQNVWLINTGTAAINVATVVSGSTDYLAEGCASTTIQPNTACELSVFFTPTVTTTDNSTVKVTSNAAGSPQTITLNGTGAAGAAAMEFSPGNLTFNSQVKATASANQFVELFNNSASTVTGIPAIAASGTNASDFTISSNSCTATLGAGSACSFNVSFKPGAAGAATAAVSISDSAGTQTLALAGYGVAATTGAVVQDSNLFFPSETASPTKLFVSPTQFVTFQNTGNTPISISSVALGGTDPGDFAISSAGCSTVTPLAAFASCNTGVQFTPTVAGKLTATVTITYTLAGGSPTNAVIALTGTGVAASQGLAVGPASITFAPTVVTTLSPLNPSVLLTNTGTSPVTITSIVLGGTDPGDFAISNGCPISPSTLQQGPLGNTCGVGVSFTPLATSVGTRTATIKITDSAPGSPTTINLSGTGVAQTKTVVVTPTTLVFGPQDSGTTSAFQYITVNNTGNFSVTFTNVATTTNYSLSNSCIGALSPASSCTIGVDFTPTATGAKGGTVTITDNATGPPQKVTLTGTGIATTANILLSQTTVVFDAQTVATASPAQLVYYYNQGNTTSTITSGVLSGTNATDFSVSSSSCATTSPSGVSALSYCYYRITFTPSAAGARAATLTIADSDPGSPRKIAISGTGVSTNVPEVDFLPASLTFATQAEGTTSAAQNINLTNNGLGNLTGLTIGLGGATPGAYAQTNNCPTTLAAGFSCNISVTFSPNAVGTITATVTATDSATGSPQSVPLTGIGKAGALPVVTLTPTSLAFAGTPLNTKVSKPVTVKNTGAAPLTFGSAAIGITGTVPSDFSQTNTCNGTSVAVGLTCTITVSFTPSTLEDQTGTLTLADNAANTPQSLPITGSGAEPAVFLAPDALAFGSVTHDTISPAQTVTLENYGTGPLTLGTITASAQFTISANTCGPSGSVIAAGSFCTISVEFTPTGTGVINGTLSIPDNAEDSPQTVALSGTGT
jgi:hypothetical protein